MIWFRDAELQQQFDRNGFVHVPFLDAAGVATLTALWHEIRPATVDGIYSNVHDRDLDTNRRVDRAITDLFSGPAAHLFGDAHLGGGSFLVKGTGPDSASNPHQDWNNVDEGSSLSLSIWCPLVDVDLDNGALQVIAGSHRVRPSIRSLDTPSLYLDFDADLDRFLTAVPARAGDAVIYAHNLFHGSKPNTTDRIRVSAVSGVLATDVRNLHYRQTGSPGVYEVLEVERDFYFSGIPAMKEGRLPATARPVGTVRLDDATLRRDDVVSAPSVLAAGGTAA